jgi:hypothetical protein
MAIAFLSVDQNAFESYLLDITLGIVEAIGFQWLLLYQMVAHSFTIRLGIVLLYECDSFLR